jgi:hypothetical protein
MKIIFFIICNLIIKIIIYLMLNKRKKTQEEIYKRKSSDGLEKECK